MNTAEISNKRRVTHDQLIEMGLIPWKSKRTTKRRIQSDAFPAYFSGQWYFDPKEVEIWWKKRKTA